MARDGRKSRHRSILVGGQVGLVERLDGNVAAKVFDHGDVDDRPSLVVIGGGFAGLLACRKMNSEFRVTLVDAKEYFEYYPGIARAYVHPKEHRKLARHYQPICDKLGVDFVWGEASRVDVEKKTVAIKEICRDTTTDRKYDYLLVTAGSEYGIELVHAKSTANGQECLWYPTFLEKGIAQSKWQGLDERFLAGRRNHLEKEYGELAALHKNKGTILVIGAGFVGVEFATEVKYYFPDIEVVIVESRNCCVGVMPESCIKYCQAYMERNGIKTIYGEKYTKFLKAPEAPPDDSPKTPAVQELRTTLDKLPELSKAWGINEPNRIYMAVGLRAINQFLPECCVTPLKGGRGGWIKTNLHQQVLCNGKPMPDVFAAGNCCEIDGLMLPKNSFPAEDMAAVACHNIRVTRAKSSNGKSAGCFGFLQAKTFKKTHWGWGTGLCATSLGPHDATMVAGSTSKSGSGRTVLWGYPSALQKEFIRWSKVDQINNGCIGSLVWKLVH